MGNSSEDSSVFLDGRTKNDFSLNFTDSSFNETLIFPTTEFDPLGRHTVWQVVVIVLFTGSLSLVTVVGNVLVFLSFRINKALKTVNNYYLLSLAFADLTIGTLSMNLYTTYIIMDQWALGPLVCDLWLTIDYVASNASVMNLLVISFDRYFSVMRPLSYRAKRTTKRAMTMIGLAWSVSFVLWAPAILFWQFIVGERTVQPNECYIQFLSEPVITFCTAIAAFYLPVSIMAVLFWKIYQETQKRAKDVQSLRGSGAANPTQNQNQNQEKKSGKGAANQRNSTAMVRQTSSQSCSSSELNQKVSGNQEENDGAGESNPPTAHKKSWLKLKRKGKASLVKRGTNSDASGCDQSPPLAAATAKDAKNSSKNEKKSNDKKAAQTLSAILLAFVMTWLPYNIMVLVNTFCRDCVPETLWALGYWLCYVNSTVNPMCYALCNKTFRSTFRDILTCRWNRRKNQTQLRQQRK
ncbi:muscarinic acetylcholine receptor M3-like [Cololabis saira]|uniref:muscarinic acetylcholine receptor M3-like n=1 Tax=Cololabis saira TaxID=129043 RepID=UPI002AD34AA5|nr:muscarinic acetylcholine receptor M3-like [Cololabis saira]